MQTYNEAINQILTEMDGFKQNEQIIVIGATNLEQAQDPAIKRPGRFDKIINVPLPDVQGRKEILEYYLNKVKYRQGEMDTNIWGKRLIGFSGADLKNFVNIAVLNSIKCNNSETLKENFDFAYDRIQMGINQPGLLIDEEEKR